MPFFIRTLLSMGVFFLIAVPFNTNAQFQSIAAVNSPAIEYAPSISANGKTLIFQSNRDGRYKLYMSQLGNDGQWSAPEPIDAINNFGDESDLIGGPSISYDGNFIYFFATFEGGVGQEDLWYSERTANGWSTPINAGNVINSRGYDGFPSISSDGESLYFMRLNEKLAGGYNCYTLVVSTKDANGNWKKPIPLPKNINLNCEKCPRIMPDNETLLFASIREGSIKSSFDMYESKLSAGGKWGPAKPLEFLNTENNEFFGSVSAEGDLIYFNAKGEQDEDILFGTIPQELRPSKVFTIEGKTISQTDKSPLQSDIQVFQKEKKVADLPSNSSDGKFTLVLKEGSYTILFSKKGYRTQRLEISVNDGKDDLLIELPILKANLMISTLHAKTNRPLSPTVIVNADNGNNPAIISEGLNTVIGPLVLGTIYRVRLKADGFEPAELIAALSPGDSSVIMREVFLVPLPPSLKLAVVDAETQRLIPAMVRVMDLKNKKYLLNGTLKDTLRSNLENGNQYRIIAKAPNYLFGEEFIDLSVGNNGTDIPLIMALSPLKVGAKLQLKEVFFETNSAEIAPDSFTELKEVFDFLGANRNLVIEISAHTDDVGDHASNQTLSEKRAQSVVDFLKEKGVPESMLVAKGYGETEPMFPNTSEENRAKNRRVEFKVTAIN